MKQIKEVIIIFFWFALGAFAGHTTAVREYYRQIAEMDEIMHEAARKCGLQIERENSK